MHVLLYIISIDPSFLPRKKILKSVIVCLFYFSLIIPLSQKLATPGETTLIYRFDKKPPIM